MISDVDLFRKRFFDNLIQEEKEKEAQLKLKQNNCFHLYKEARDSYGYPCRMCSKCELVTYQKIRGPVVKKAVDGCIIS